MIKFIKKLAVPVMDAESRLDPGILSFWLLSFSLLLRSYVMVRVSLACSAKDFRMVKLRRNTTESKNP
jgi:hypothetical protein